MMTDITKQHKKYKCCTLTYPSLNHRLNGILFPIPFCVVHYASTKSKQRCVCAKQPHRQTMFEWTAFQKTYKSPSLLDSGALSSEGHSSHQTCADCSTSSSIQLNTNCLSHTHLDLFGFFIAFITRFPMHTKLVPLKK